MKPRTLTLAEVMAGAERAHKRVSRWPQWKRDVSRIGSTGMREKDDERFMSTRTQLFEITVIRSVKNSEVYKFEVGGKVGRIALKGETLPVHIGIDRISKCLADQIVRVFRVDGSGHGVPYATRRKVVNAVYVELQKLVEEHDAQRKERTP